MNWREGFRRIGLLFAVPMMALIALGIAGRLFEAAIWVEQHPLFVAGAAATYLIIWWIATGFKQPIDDKNDRYSPTAHPE